jgi:hypothetical protein
MSKCQPFSIVATAKISLNRHWKKKSDGGFFIADHRNWIFLLMIVRFFETLFEITGAITVRVRVIPVHTVVLGYMFVVQLEGEHHKGIRHADRKKQKRK